MFSNPTPGYGANDTLRKDGGEASLPLRMSEADAAKQLATGNAWRGLPTLAQLALYRREDGAYFCAVEGCEIVGPPERDSDRMVAIGPLVFCHAHGKTVHHRLRAQYGADSECRWHYLSKTVHFSEQVAQDMKSPRFTSADEVAEAILGGQYVERAGKRPRADGYEMETQCVVAVNAPMFCNRWGDWGEMPTASVPSHDGSPPRAHYGFCPECAAVCEAAELTLGPSLREMITGRRPEVTTAAVAMPASQNDGQVGWDAVEEQLRRGQLGMSFGRVVCNMTPAITGDPRDGLDQIPVFKPEDFPDHYAGDRALDDTSGGKKAAADGGGPACWYCKQPGASQEYGGMPTCKRCKNRLTRPKREARAVARSAADRAAATGGSGGGGKKKGR